MLAFEAALPTRSCPLAERLHDYRCRPEDVEIAAHYPAAPALRTR